MRLGFSYVGLIFLLMVIVPNVLWTKNKPDGYERYSANENMVLKIVEHVGRVLTIISALIFSDLNFREWTPWCLFLVVA
ncbi:MAG: hypothetical protein IKR73_04485, partial [Oscillospiraceae bacterium]|nr:hypothetical protein [Oscillospiraceae bacterium]